MSRLLLAFVFVAALSATALAANVHFYVAGEDPDLCPTTAISVPEGVGPTTVELHVDTEGAMVGPMVADLTPSTAPLPAVATFLPGFTLWSAYDGAGLFSGSGDAFMAGPGDLAWASMSLDTQNWAPGAYVLKASGPATSIGDASGVPLPTSTTDLTITIVPEPATLGLLVLGGLAALRRRFA